MGHYTTTTTTITTTIIITIKTKVKYVLVLLIFLGNVPENVLVEILCANTLSPIS